MRLEFSMRLLLASSLVVLLVTMPRAFAQETAPQRPAGFDNFFQEMEQLVKKYPEAGKRFSLFDSKSTPRAGESCGGHKIPCCTNYVPPCCGQCATKGC